MLEKDTQIKRLKNNRSEKFSKPLSKKTILEHHRLLRAMLHKAVYWQLIANNPAERVQPPKTKKPKRRYYDDEQYKLLLEKLENQEIKCKERFDTYLRFHDLFYVGCRTFLFLSKKAILFYS